MLYRPNSDTATSSGQERTISGQFIAHGRLSPKRRAFVAADIALGKARLEKLTLTQAARLVGVSVVYARAARKVTYCRPDLRSGCETGLNPFPLSRSRPERLAQLWAKATAAERIQFAREVGPDALLNTAAEAE